MSFKLASLAHAAAGAALVLAAGAANASLYNFDISGAYTAHWQMDSSADPIDSSFGAEYRITSGTFQGSSDNNVGLSFYSSADGGGLSIWDGQNGLQGLLSALGPQVFTGTDADPTFTLGDFTLTKNERGSTETYLLSITDAAATVPEPGSLALMAACFGALAFTMRRSKKA